MTDRPSAEAVAAAARRLGCDAAAILAVIDVESGPWGAFLPDGHPVILFERHLFRRYTDGRFDQIAPDLSSPKPGGYGKASAQPDRKQRAMELDREAALMACSWGLFQILGANWQRCGCASLDQFVERVSTSVDEQLALFVAFVRSDPRLRFALRDQDWWTFARWYNGPQHARHDYAGRLARAYLKHGGRLDDGADPPPVSPTEGG